MEIALSICGIYLEYAQIGTKCLIAVEYVSNNEAKHSYSHNVGGFTQYWGDPNGTSRT